MAGEEKTVWVQLYIGKKKSGEDPFQVRVAVNSNINDLKEAVKEKRSNALATCDAADLLVYKLVIVDNKNEKVKLKPGNAVPTGTTDENPLVVVAPPQGQTQTNQAMFRHLLKQSGVTATEEVMDVIVRNFASSVALVDTPKQAHDLYSQAVLLPRSATSIVLQQQGISVANVFRGGGADPSKAVLLCAHQNGIPRILKVATAESIRHENSVWSAIQALVANQQHLQPHHLVPLDMVKFVSATIVVGDVFGGSSSLPPPKCGLLMKQYQGTLSQCKVPLTDEVLLHYGQQLRKAVSTLHQAGYCHLDIKPSNIFLFEEDCYLGDYGAAVEIDRDIRERTINYYPKDGSFKAEKKTDMYLLAVTLLEMFGSIPKKRDYCYAKQQIHDKIAQVGNEKVRDFLSSLFNDP